MPEQTYEYDYTDSEKKYRVAWSRKTGFSYWRYSEPWLGKALGYEWQSLPETVLFALLVDLCDLKNREVGRFQCEDCGTLDNALHMPSCRSGEKK